MLVSFISVGIIIATVFYIIKGYSATGVLMTAGIALLIAAVLLDKNILPASVTPTESNFLNIIEYIKYLLMSRAGDLGMMIMILCGFSAYMTHIGANDAVVQLLVKPLKYINSPYLLMVFAYFLACIMSLAVSSATGLGVLLMATLFPIMVNVGISRGASAAICASPVALILAPTSGDVVLAAKASNMELTDFALNGMLPISIVAIIAMAIAHFFWQRFLDKKEQTESKLTHHEITLKVPRVYAILPFIPIIGVLVFNGEFAPKLHIITILVGCIIFVALLEFMRTFDAKRVFKELESCYQGMADAFMTVVMLLVAAGVFANGLTSIGFINDLILTAQSFASASIAMMLTLVIITMLAAIATGSGNAPFYAFVELIPSIAVKMGINPAYLAIPMLQASNLGRTISPVAGVIVAVSGMAKISPFEVVKRTSVPVMIGLLVVIIGTELWIPSTL